MRRIVLVLAQIGSLIMIPVSVYEAWKAESIWMLAGGCVFWLAMFYVFGFVDEALRRSEGEDSGTE